MKIFKTMLGVLMILIVFVGFLVATGLIELEFYRYFGIQRASIRREIFKENKSYVEGMISDLAKYRYEYQREEDEKAKKAIADLIRTKFSNFNLDNIENDQLKRFLINIREDY